MLISPPPACLSVDETLWQVGRKICGSDWTGRESKAVSVRRLNYWSNPEGLLSIEVSQSPEHHSDKYLWQQMEENESISRYRFVAIELINLLRCGEYLAVLLDDSGTFCPVDGTAINSEEFQNMIADPNTPNRERLYLVLRKDIPGVIGLALSPNSADRAAESSGRSEQSRNYGSGSEPAPEPPEPTRREASKQKIKDMHDKWRELADKCQLDGRRRTREEIAKMIAKDPDARHPRKGTAPRWQTVKRELNRPKSP
jgi:hypothetical protein